MSLYEDNWESNNEVALAALDRLRVNRYSLAQEARILKKLAQSRRAQPLAALNAHRTGRLREQARASHLAWGFVLGRDYDDLEGPTTVKKVDYVEFARKVRMALGYHPDNETLEAWLPTDDEQMERARRNQRTPHAERVRKPRHTKEEWDAIVALE